MRIGINIVKSTTFRTKEQEFNNTYYYELGTAVTAPSESLVDQIVAKERTLHATVVAFKRAQVWTAGGTKAQNQMIFQKTLTGTGDQVANVGMDRERAVLVQWKAGFDSRGIQVYLRKWYHSCGQCAGQNLSDNAVLANTGPIPDTARTAIQNSVQQLRDIGTGEFWSLCAKSGRSTTHDAVAHRFLEHHQLGEMWR